VSNRSLPTPVPGRWNPAGPYRNPGSTNPLPAPANLPSQAWFGARVPIVWQAMPADSGSLFRATWASPVFDLYPQLRGTSEDSSNQLAAGAIPIWSGPGALFRFQVTSPETDGLDGVNLTGFKVRYREYGHITQVTQVQSIEAAQDITAQFTAAQESSVVTLQPRPLRYYRVTVRFDVLEDFGYPDATGPRLAIQGAMY